MDKGLTKRKILAYQKGKLLAKPDLVIREEPLEIRLNGQAVGLLMQTPGEEKALAVGYLFTEGYIREFKEVFLLRHCGSGKDALLSPNLVEVEAKTPVAPRPLGNIKITGSSCGICAKEAVEFIVREIPPVQGNFILHWEVLSPLFNQAGSLQTLYQKTGGTHAVFIFDAKGNLLVQAEDVGRHNAMDKVVGKALMARLPLGNCFALLSGRASYEMVLKTARAGLPILIAISAPTQMALDLARRLKITVAGFFRGHRLNVYTHPSRIIFD